MRRSTLVFAFSMVVIGPVAWGQELKRSTTELKTQDRKLEPLDHTSILNKLQPPGTQIPSGSTLRKKQVGPAIPPKTGGGDTNPSAKDATGRQTKDAPFVPRRLRPIEILPGRNLPDIQQNLTPNRNLDSDPFGIGSRRKLGDGNNFSKDLLNKEAANLPDIELANTGHSFRIATFNTHLISPIFNKEIFDSRHADADAHNIADAIVNDSTKEQSFDVIVLNEVWDEDAKKILVKRLAPIFPYYVEKLDAPDGTTANAQISGGTVQVPKIEDSGLMLFSKLPIVDLKIGTPTQVAKQAFHWFDACSGIDAAACKGVGAVAIHHPQAQRQYLVAFTHLQDGDAVVRESQMAEIRGFLQSLRSLNPELRRGETFLLGDLNIEGVNLLEKNDPNWAPANEKQQEWVDQFLKKQSYFFYPLYDAWAWTTSAADQGYTNPGGNQRLDYIIHEREAGRPQPYAVQHIHHVMVGETDSDHIAVAADLNVLGIASVPRLAMRPELNKSKGENWWDYAPDMETNNGVLSGELVEPGAMQWYRFDKRGTYSIGIPEKLANQGLEVTVFQANDLSTPIAVYNKEYSILLLGKDPPYPFKVGKYHIGEPPFFVRISNPRNRTWRGKYEIGFHRHRGAIKEDAITLRPGESPIDPEMPIGKPLNTDDKVWFEFITDRAHSNKPQDVEIKVENPSGEKLMLDLIQQDPIDPTITLQLLSTNWVDQPFVQQEELGGKKFYLNLSRKEVTQTGFRVGWTTNLTWLVGMGIPGITWPFKLVCTDETDSDWTGSDEIVFQIFVDGTLYSKEYFDDVDTGNHFSYEGLIEPVAFLEKVEATICEIGAADEPDCNLGKIDLLSKTTSTELHKWVDLFPDDGNYEFRFNLSHWLNK